MLEMSSGGIGDDSQEVGPDTPMTQQEGSQSVPHSIHPRPPHNVKGPAQGSKRKKFMSKFTPPKVKMPNVSSPFKKINLSRSSNKPPKSSVQKNTVYVDLENRDPYNLNNHVKTGFDEVIGEPEGAHSAPRIWSNVNKAFHAGRNCCFTVLTYLCAIPLVFCWGCNFACITFMHIYSITPCFRVFFINCDCASKFFSTIVHCACDPIYEAIALTFTKIYVNFNQSSSVYQEKTYAGTRLFARDDINPLVTKPLLSEHYEGAYPATEDPEVIIEEKHHGGSVHSIHSIHSIHSLHDDPQQQNVQTYVNADQECFVVEEDRRSSGKGQTYQDV